MQRHLILPPAYDPLPSGRDCYVPVLQNRSGERTALKHAGAAVWASMTPVLELVPTRKAGTSASSLRAAIKRIRESVGDHPVYLDVKRLDPCALVKANGTELHALEVIYEAARKRGLSWMPVAWAHSGDEHLAMVREAADQDGQGLALRCVLEGLRMESPLVAATRVVESLSIDPSMVDLVLDLGYLDPDAEPDGQWIAQLINDTCARHPWRSIVLVATSVPSTFGNGLVEPQTLGELQRTEWSLWKDVSSRCTRQIAYGDYGVQHPTPPPTAPPFLFANVRYSLEDRWLIARGQKTRDVDSSQYIDLCNMIVGHERSRPKNYTYGDQEIHRWAAGEVRLAGANGGDWDWEPEEDSDPSGAWYWRGVAASHHFRQVSEQLAIRANQP